MHFCTLKVYVCTLKVCFRTLPECLLQVAFKINTARAKKRLVINVYFKHACCWGDTTYVFFFLRPRFSLNAFLGFRVVWVGWSLCGFMRDFLHFSSIDWEFPWFLWAFGWQWLVSWATIRSKVRMMNRLDQGLGCLDFPNLLHAGSCNAQVEGSGGGDETTPKQMEIIRF